MSSVSKQVTTMGNWSLALLGTLGAVGATSSHGARHLRTPIYHGKREISCDCVKAREHGPCLLQQLVLLQGHSLPTEWNSMQLLKTKSEFNQWSCRSFCKFQ